MLVPLSWEMGVFGRAEIVTGVPGRYAELYGAREAGYTVWSLLASYCGSPHRLSF